MVFSHSWEGAGTQDGHMYFKLRKIAVLCIHGEACLIDAEMTNSYEGG